jgi:hypothetical protein
MVARTRDGAWPKRWNGSYPLDHAELIELLEAVIYDLLGRSMTRQTAWLLAAYQAELERVRADQTKTYRPTVVPTVSAVLVPGSILEPARSTGSAKQPMALCSVGLS